MMPKKEGLFQKTWRLQYLEAMGKKDNLNILRSAFSSISSILIVIWLITNNESSLLILKITDTAIPCRPIIGEGAGLCEVKLGESTNGYFLFHGSDIQLGEIA